MLVAPKATYITHLVRNIVRNIVQLNDGTQNVTHFFLTNACKQVNTVSVKKERHTGRLAHTKKKGKLSK